MEFIFLDKDEWSTHNIVIDDITKEQIIGHQLPPAWYMYEQQYEFADKLNNYLDWELDQEYVKKDQENVD
jgi:hypothetical protein